MCAVVANTLPCLFVWLFIISDVMKDCVAQGKSETVNEFAALVILVIKYCERGLWNYTRTHFYTPVWKTGRIMPWQCPSVRLSVRLSVRPSVRPRFPDFSSTSFEISIWNLVYAFSRWHDISSLSCITIGSIWPSLQPKVGQTYFLQSWPHKSR